MRKHLATEQLRAYGKHRLSPAELIEADAHLAECSACRDRIESVLPASTVALYADLQREAESATHLSFEQLAAYVEDTLKHAESLVVSDHLVTCSQCAHAASDLRNFAATNVSQRPAVISQKGWWAGWWERAREWVTAPAFGWATAALLLVFLTGWLMRGLWQRPPNAPLVVQQDKTPTPLPAFSPTPTAPETVPLLAQLNDGGQQITLDAQGKLSGLEALPPAQQQLVKEALTSQRLEHSAVLADLRRRGSSLMGPSSNKDDEGHQFALHTPAGKVVLSDRPAFKWSSLAGATSYVVEIYDEQFKLVTQSESLAQTQWMPPRRLARGKVYTWQVKATKAGQTVTAPAPPAPQARFRVVSAPQAADIAQAQRAAAGQHLSLAILYVQAGLLDEAERELRALRQANPQAEIVNRWLAQLQAMRR